MRVKKYEGFPEHYRGFKCPGCKRNHIIPTGDRNVGGNWEFNGDYDSPTFKPSILARGTHFPTDEEVEQIKQGKEITPRPLICHSFVKNGMIEFLSDCTHELKGQTVALSEISEDG